ncbi:MAG: aldo/keto reductase [Pirellulales bacterium]|nr:aldo/keto reductase [Pirellulales bacterium]
MKYRRLGRTGLAVSPLCLGTMGFGPPLRPADAERLVRTAIDAGVNFIDTANCYDGPRRGDVVHGHAEAMLGEILAGGLRHEVVLVSKAGVPLRDGPQNRGLSATHLLRELDNSLRRLKTDYLDVFMIHWPDAFAAPEEVLRAVHTAAAAGKIRHFGISNHAAWQVCEYLWIADRRNWPPPCVSELPFSLLDRRYENDLPFYGRHDVAVLAYQPLAGGRLSERRLQSSSTDEPSGGQPSSVMAMTKEVDVVRRLAALASSHGTTLSAMALAWAVARPNITSLVLGARTTEQLVAAVAAVGVMLPADFRERVEEAAPGPPVPNVRFER